MLLDIAVVVLISMFFGACFALFLHAVFGWTWKQTITDFVFGSIVMVLYFLSR